MLFKMVKIGRAALVAAAVCMAAAPSFAEAKSATLSATGYSGTETITGFPALVKLSASDDAYGFSYSDCVNGKDDLWFEDADGNLIPHDVDTWNETGDSYVWVRIPSLSNGAKIVMHWGAARTAEQTCTTADTWAGYVGVWHMNETGTTAEPDATANNLSAAPVLGSGGNSTSIDTATGQIGAGRAVTQGTMLKVTGHSVSDAKVFTISGWAKRTGTGDYPRIFVGNTDSNRTQWELYGQSGTELRIRGGTKELTGCSVNIGTAAGWHYLTVRSTTRERLLSLGRSTMLLRAVSSPSVDGREEATAASSASSTKFACTTASFRRTAPPPTTRR